MTSTNDQPGRRKARLLTVVAAVAGALVIWTVASIAGVDFTSPTFGQNDPFDINAGFVITTAAAAGLAAWALLAVLERVSSRPRTLWTVIASVVLVLSLGGPLSGEDADGSVRFLLVLMHVVVGLTLIAGLRRTAAGAAAPVTGAVPGRTRA